MIPQQRPDSSDEERMRVESKFDWQYAMKEFQTHQKTIEMELSEHSLRRAEKEKQDMEEKIKQMEEM